MRHSCASEKGKNGNFSVVRMALLAPKCVKYAPKMASYIVN